MPAVALDRLPEIVGRQLTTYGKVHKERPDGREVQASGRCPDPSSPEGRRPADRARCALSVAGAPCREDGAVRARQPAKAVSSCAGASAFRLTASPPPEGGGACPVRCAMWARKGLEDGSAVVPVCCAGPDALGERERCALPGRALCPMTAQAPRWIVPWGGWLMPPPQGARNDPSGLSGGLAGVSLLAVDACRLLR